jgi:nucleotide-binding universal stress UspA family protein
MRVLLATDFSTNAEKARDLVAGLALPPDSTVQVVHAIEPMPYMNAFAPMPMLELSDYAERELRGELETFVRPLLAADRTVERVLPFGRAADVIVRQAERHGADLIVIGSRGRGGVASMILGSVSAEVVDRAPCAVLVARGRTLHRLLLAEDGSASAASGAALIASLPPLRSLPVRVVSVAETGSPYGATMDPLASSAAVEAYYDALPAFREERERLGRERARQLRDAGVSATSEFREGDAAAELIKAAARDRSDCIVIGSRGRTGLTRAVLGSVARAVLFHGDCSVLVTHAPIAGTVPDRLPAATFEHGLLPKR